MPEGKKPVTRKAFTLVRDDNVVDGERVGDQIPPNCWVPDYTKSRGDKAIAWLHAVGVHLDPWQQFCLREMLGEKPNGKWAAKEIVLLTPRQNGKTLVAEARELVGLFLFGEKLIIHSAQLFPTAHESYLRMCSLINAAPGLKKYVLKMRSGNNNVGIELRSDDDVPARIRGSRLLYMARGKDQSRGFSGDLVVLDEAYNLDPDAVGAMIPALSARPNPQVIYTSSTGDDESVVLLKVRDRGLNHEPGVALFEWCADEGANPHDKDQWYKANPALGIRIDEDFVIMELGALEPKMFARERLGLWADNSLRAPIDAETWESCRDQTGESQIASRVVLAVDASPDRALATIALAGYTADGRKQVEVESSGRGISWCVDAIDALFNATDSDPPLAVCVQAGARAGALIPELEALGIEVIPFSTREILGSTGFFYDSVIDQTLVHLGDASVATGLSGARQYNIGGKVGDDEYNGWGWTRSDTTVDITGVCALTYALWGLNMKRSEAIVEQKPYEGKPRGGRVW